MNLTRVRFRGIAVFIANNPTVSPGGLPILFYDRRLLTARH